MNNPFKRNQEEKTGPSTEDRAARILELQDALLDESITDEERQTIAAEIAHEGRQILNIVKDKALRTAKIALIVILVVVALAIAAVYLSSQDEELTDEDESEGDSLKENE